MWGGGVYYYTVDITYVQYMFLITARFVKDNTVDVFATGRIAAILATSPRHPNISFSHRGENVGARMGKKPPKG